ncbi:hypothetical protein K491DRAFT_757978 [Lophiostoma macrostomum CBS 122681]|uniref:F-box domain-containing protein n=1 Tax=Lophiostoma macrostomum CBS 122681 TaxID=1314788 RepID=A0A6A6T8Z2_9PLEO|nr:hypothetical protein K491DRAFT_757978 [Lophiostoma macrostomum CBS 122681]
MVSIASQKRKRQFMDPGTVRGPWNAPPLSWYLGEELRNPRFTQVTDLDSSQGPRGHIPNSTNRETTKMPSPPHRKRRASDSDAPPYKKACQTMTPSFLMPPILASKPIGTMCFFMDELPPELRLEVYKYLVVADEPLSGNGERGLHLAVLRVNRQIHEEAKALFYARNKFHVTSSRVRLLVPEVKDELNIQNGEVHFLPKVQQDNPIHFEPPLHPSTWKLLRHVTIDLNYYPATLTDSNIIDPHGPEERTPRRKFNRSCITFANQLTALVHAAGPHLLSLHLTSNVEDDFFASDILSTHMLLSKNRVWGMTLAYRLRPAYIAYSMEFSNCHFRARLPRDLFARSRRDFGTLAAHVQLCVPRILFSLFTRDAAYPRDRDGKTDLVPLVKKYWKSLEQDLGFVGTVFDEELCEKEENVMCRLPDFAKPAGKKELGEELGGHVKDVLEKAMRALR